MYIRKVPTIAVLFLFWLGMSGIFSHFIIICALFSVAFSVVILSWVGAMPDIKISPIGIKYTFLVLRDILLSSISVSRKIWSEDFNIESSVGVMKFDKITDNKVGLVMHANAITTTPGTIILGVHENEMLVHFFNKEDATVHPSDHINKLLSQ